MRTLIASPLNRFSAERSFFKDLCVDDLNCTAPLSFREKNDELSPKCKSYCEIIGTDAFSRHAGNFIGSVPAPAVTCEMGCCWGFVLQLCGKSILPAFIPCYL